MQEMSKFSGNLKYSFLVKYLSLLSWAQNDVRHKKVY